MKPPIMFLFLISAAITLPAQPSIQWQKCLGGTATDQANAIEQTSDGGYIVAGFTMSNDGDVSGNHGNEDFWVVKLDAAGNIQWQTCLGGTADEQAESVQQTSDGGYIVAGYTSSNDGEVSGNHGSEDCWVVKLNVSGALLWQKCLGGTFIDNAKSVDQTNDGGYIVAGYTFSNDGDVSGNNGKYDYWVVKLDNNGNIQWQKCFGGTDSEYANSVQQMDNGEFIITGYTYSNNGDVSGNHGSYDYWVAKLDSDGILQWQKCLGGTGFEVSYSVQNISNGGFVTAGSAGSNNGNVSGNCNPNGIGFEWDQWIVQLNSNGNIAWQKCLGGTDQDIAFSAQETIDGGFIVGGNAWSTNGNVIGNHGSSDYWLVKLDLNGNIEWQKCLGGSNFEMAKSTIQTSDEGFVMAGFTFSNDGDVSGNNGNYDVWIVKLLPISAPLPVELMSFAGEAKLGYNKLTWITASEVNNDYFTVLKSTNENHFEPIGKIDGAGNSDQILNYSFIDAQTIAGINYYRLQQTDFNGKSTFSEIIALKNEKFSSNEFTLYPNPANEFIEIGIEVAIGHLEIVILNLLGETMVKKRNERTIDVSQFPTGTYFLKLKVENQVYSNKFIKH